MPKLSKYPQQETTLLEKLQNTPKAISALQILILSAVLNACDFDSINKKYSTTHYSAEIEEEDPQGDVDDTETNITSSECLEKLNKFYDSTCSEYVECSVQLDDNNAIFTLKTESPEEICTETITNIQKDPSPAHLTVAKEDNDNVISVLQMTGILDENSSNLSQIEDVYQIFTGIGRRVRLVQNKHGIIMGNQYTFELDGEVFNVVELTGPGAHDLERTAYYEESGDMIVEYSNYDDSDVSINFQVEKPSGDIILFGEALPGTYTNWKVNISEEISHHLSIEWEDLWEYFDLNDTSQEDILVTETEGNTNQTTATQTSDDCSCNLPATSHTSPKNKLLTFLISALALFRIRKQSKKKNS